MNAPVRTPPRPVVYLPWLDRAGRLSWLKLATFVAVLAPGAWLAVSLAMHTLGAKPVTAAIHETGDWAVRFLVLSLAITPLRRIAAAPKLILVRRMVGIAALGYALVHFTLYIVDQGFDLAHVASEIVLRFYLTIGFVALVGLSVLGATSTDAMIRRLGGAWQKLHRIVYGIVILALLHYFLQTKLNVAQPVLWAGLFLLLMGHRLLQRVGQAARPLPLLGLAVAAGLATALLETAWYATATGVSASQVLEANLDFSYEIRPAWWVLAVGLGLVVVNLVRVRGDAKAATAARGRAPARRAA